MGSASLAAQLRAIDFELQAGNPSGALAMIEASRQKWPVEQGILLREALCRYRLGEKAQALQLQRELAARFPDSPAAASRLIAWSIEAGDAACIRPLLDAWRIRLPDNPGFWLNEIHFLHLTDQQNARLAELRRFVQRHSGVEEGWRSLIRAEHNSGIDNLLDTAIRRGLMALPDSLGIARVALEVSLAAQNVELAILAHESLLRIDPVFDAKEPQLLCRLELLRIVRRYRGGEEDAALVEISALIGRFPEVPGPARQYSHWLSSRGRFAEALSLVEVWRKRLPGDSDFALREIQLLRKMGDTAQAWVLCDDLINNQPALESAWVERILLTRDESLNHLWHETAVQAVALFPNAFSIIQAAYAGAIESGKLDFMSEALREFLGKYPDSLQGLRLAAGFYEDQAEYSKALCAIEAGLSKFPDDYPLLHSRLRVSWALGQRGAGLVSWAQGVLEHPQVNLAGINSTLRILLDAGENELLGKLLQDVVHNALLDSGARDFAAKAFNSLHLVHDGSASTTISKFGGAVVLRLPPKVSHVVLGFNGLAGMLPIELLLPIFDKLGLGAIFLSDRQKLLFLNGVAELADDYDKTLSALRDLLPDSVTKISCLGNSAGGYAALRYAIDLNASSAMLFAPPTNLDADACARDGRARIVAKRIHKVVPHQAVNLAQALVLSSHRPKVHLWYGGAMTQDREHALNMAGVPGVALHEEPGYEGHDVIWHLASTGRLEDVVRQAIIN